MKKEHQQNIILFVVGVTDGFTEIELTVLVRHEDGGKRSGIVELDILGIIVVHQVGHALWTNDLEEYDKYIEEFGDYVM